MRNQIHDEGIGNSQSGVPKEVVRGELNSRAEVDDQSYIYRTKSDSVSVNQIVERVHHVEGPKQESSN